MFCLCTVSDVFFVVTVWVSVENLLERLILVFIGSLFLIVPVNVNLFQLRREIEKWTNDSDTRMILYPWIKVHASRLLSLCLLSGSAFSAIELCDSHLFQLPIFSFNIPQRQKQVFKNQRIFSIVLLENIPQFFLQLIYLLFFVNSNSTDFESNITFFAMFFSVLSVILTIFEYNTKKFLLESEYLTIVKFKLDSVFIRNMKANEWKKNILNKRGAIPHELSKMLGISYEQMEQLKPIECLEGAQIIVHIRSDIEFVETSKIMNEIEKSISNKKLAKVIQKCYQLPGKPNIIQVEVNQRGPENKGTSAVETIAIRSNSNNININGKTKNINKTSNINIQMLNTELKMQQQAFTNSLSGDNITIANNMRNTDQGAAKTTDENGTGTHKETEATPGKVKVSSVSIQHQMQRTASSSLHDSDRDMMQSTLTGTGYGAAGHGDDAYVSEEGK